MNDHKNISKSIYNTKYVLKKKYALNKCKKM